MSRAGAPEWYVSGKLNRYQPEFYLIGLGEGESRDAAIEQASAQILRQIEVEINSEITSIISSYKSGDAEVITEDFKSVGNSVAKGSLKGVQIAEEMKSDGKFYVFMVIDKDNYATGLETELNQHRNNIQNQYSDNESLLNDGKVFEALDVLLKTETEAKELYGKAALYSYLSGRTYPTAGILSGEAIISSIRKILGEIKLKKISGDDQSAKTGSLLPSPPLGFHGLFPFPYLGLRDLFLPSLPNFFRCFRHRSNVHHDRPHNEQSRY